MKIKKSGIRKRIVCFLIAAFIVFAAVFILSHRINGKATVRVNGEKYSLTDLECKYLDHGGEETVKTWSIGSSPLRFMSGGFQYGRYEYSFPVSSGEIAVRPEIVLFKTNNWRGYHLDIHVDLVKEGETWNGYVTIKVDGRTYTETFTDIAHNEMVIRVE